MIEQTIYFAIGCIATALAALAFAPLFWHRALRLTRARLQLQVPLSMREILAERDQLRAEFAVKQLESEQALERVRASKTRDMALIGRQSVAATAMADEIVALRELSESQQGEIRHLLEDLAVVQAEAAAIRVELHDSHGLADRWRDQSDRDAEARTSLRTELDEKYALATSLETQMSDLETHLADAQRTAEQREQGLRGRLEAAMAHSARHETSAVTLRRELDEARQRIRRLELELAAANAEALAHEKKSPRQDVRNGSTKDTGPSSHATIADLRAENEALLERLAELQHLGAAVGATDREATHDDAGLRAEIHALGLAVSRMTLAIPDSPGRERQAETVPSPSDAA